VQWKASPKEGVGISSTSSRLGYFDPIFACIDSLQWVGRFII
jgi:hypothetical protein